MMRALTLVLLAGACTPVSDLVETTDEPAGSNCAYGGTAIREGADENQDGALQDSEIDSVQYVCEAAPVTSELVVVTPEPPGTNCALGGKVVRTGTDANRDGILDADEVRATAYVCNGQLVETRPEPEGLNCLTGGTAILVGDDGNADGILNEDEVASTSYVCDGVFDGTLLDGSFNVRNNLDVALIANIEEITGPLIIDNWPDSLASASLPALERVGSLIVYDEIDLSLPSLRTVVASARLGRHQASATSHTLAIPKLETVGGFIEFYGNWVAFDTPELVSVGGDLLFGTNSELQRIVAPALARVDGTVRIQRLPSLAAVDLSSLATLSGLNVSTCPNLAQEDFSLPPVQGLPDGLWVERVPWTSLGPLSTITTGSVGVLYMPITGIALPNLTTAGQLVIYSDTATSFSAPMLQSISGNVFVDAPLLPSCQVTSVLDAIGFQGTRSVRAAPCVTP
ncbi:MAG: hypothetical protein SFX73_04420 [Kofleriaceae bacterium]|nr:hypothetical protein [Kofleriaceae bacterium]